MCSLKLSESTSNELTVQANYTVAAFHLSLETCCDIWKSWANLLSRFCEHWFKCDTNMPFVYADVDLKSECWAKLLTVHREQPKEEEKALSPSTALLSCSLHLIHSLTQIYEGNCCIINEWCRRFSELVINKKNGCGQVSPHQCTSYQS